MRTTIVLLALLLWACAPDAKLGDGGHGGNASSAGGAGGAGGEVTTATGGGGAAGGAGGTGGGDCPRDLTNGLTGEIRWATSFSGENIDLAYAVDADDAGGFAIGLFTEGGTTIDFGNGDKTGEAFVATFDVAHAPRWSRSAEADGIAGVEAVAFDGTDLLTAVTFGGNLTGDYTGTGIDAFDSNILVARHTATGSLADHVEINNGGLLRVLSIDLLSTGAVVICGAFSGNTTFADDVTSTEPAIFVAAYNGSLDPIWQHVYGSTSLDGEVLSCRLDVDTNDDIHFFANFNGALASHTTVDGEFDIFVGKLSADGTTLASSVTYAGPERDHATAIAAYTDGGSIIAGQHVGALSLDDLTNSSLVPESFVARVEPDYTTRWVTRLTGSGIEKITGVAVDSVGHIVVVGYVDAPAILGDQNIALTGTRTGFVAKLDCAGAVLWVRRLPSTINVSPAAVTVGPDDIITVVGSFSGVLDATIANLTAEAPPDVFVVQLAP